MVRPAAAPATRLRLVLGRQETNLTLAALRFMRDTWANGDDPLDAEDRDLFRRLDALRAHIKRDAERQGVRYAGR